MRRASHVNHMIRVIPALIASLCLLCRTVIANGKNMFEPRNISADRWRVMSLITAASSQLQHVMHGNDADRYVALPPLTCDQGVAGCTVCMGGVFCHVHAPSI